MPDQLFEPRLFVYAFDRGAMFAALAMIGFALTGCSGTDAPTPIFTTSTNYAAVPLESEAGVPHAAALSLYHYPEGPKGPSSLVWPHLTSDQEAVFEQLVIFNGGLSDDITWRYYPALLAYAGSGEVVDITQPACRHIPGWHPNWTNYAFSVLAVSNRFVRLDVNQCLPVDTNRPTRLEVDLEKADILKMVQTAQTNGEAKEYGGVKYLVAR